MYKIICAHCNGNGYIHIQDKRGKTEVKQCWTCESQGELTYDEKDIKKISNGIHITNSLKRV
jgi:DnaJ-class molecular chaperone